MAYGGECAEFDTMVESGQEFRLLSFDVKCRCYQFISLMKHNADTFEAELYGTITLQRYQAREGYVFEAGTDYPSWPEEKIPEAYRWAMENCIERRLCPRWWKNIFNKISYAGYSAANPAMYPNFALPETSERDKRQYGRQKPLEPWPHQSKVERKNKNSWQGKQGYYDDERAYRSAWERKSDELEYHI